MSNKTLTVRMFGSVCKGFHNSTVFLYIPFKVPAGRETIPFIFRRSGSQYSCPCNTHSERGLRVNHTGSWRNFCVQSSFKYIFAMFFMYAVLKTSKK